VSVREVHVEYGRTISDGDYGSERWTVGLTAELERDEDADEVVADLGGRAQELVVGQFKTSTNERILRNVLPREEWEARLDRQREQARERAGLPRPKPVPVDQEDDAERPF
jgi:hypothetical protein